MNEQQLREEFQKFADSIIWSNDDGSEKYIGVGNVADWWIEKIAQAIAEERERERVVVNENTSDGYHTFKELYEFRKIYNAVLFNEWTIAGKYEIHKSKKHGDGEECFGGGWFIVMATLPTGQISNHYELRDWDLFDCEERELADKWDGHTSQDVLTRLSALKNPKSSEKAEDINNKE